MKLKILISLMFISYITYSIQNEELSQKFIIPKDPIENYRELCTTLIRMMENSSIASKRNLNVLIFSMLPKKLLYFFEGFHAMFNKIESNIVSTQSITHLKFNKTFNTDFVILLIYKPLSNYNIVIKNGFDHAFPSALTRMIVIAVDTDDMQFLIQIFISLIESNFHNLHGVLQKNSKNHDIYQVKIKKLKNGFHMSEEKLKGESYKMPSEILKKGDVEIIKIVHFNTFPITYIKDGIIYGADGNLIHEFCKKYGFIYELVNDGNEKSNIKKMLISLRKNVDILLSTNLYPVTNKMIGVWLNEMDGSCLLVPRNIPISSIENLTLPFDSLSVAFMALSVGLMIVCWKIITIITNKQVSTLNIALDVYQLTFGMGISTLDRLSLKEKLMIVCFMFSSFILATTYQSIILSLMLMDTGLRSAKNLHELNASDTKFYMFYDQGINYDGDPLFIRRELILNVRNFNETFELPSEIDYNLVYFVSCKNAKFFIQSPKNVHDGKRLFDRMIFSPMLQAYSVNVDFYYKEEFKLFVSALTESGIYSFWEQEFINSKDIEMVESKHEFEMMIEFHNMKVPFIILATGYLAAVQTFLIERLFDWLIRRRFKLCQKLFLST